jgi:Peptidase family M23
MLNKIIITLVKWLFPYPLISGILSHLAVKYKFPIMAVLLSVLFLPVFLVMIVFASTSKINAADSLRFKREYFDRKYSSICRADSSKCESKPGIFGFLGCIIDPTECRIKRPKVDCSIEIQGTKYCHEEIVDGASVIVVNSDGNEIFYQDQQNEEENGGEYGKYTDGTVFENIDTSGSPGLALAISTLPTSLIGYIEPFINDIGTPNGNPLGGLGFQNVTVNCFYHCAEYLAGGGVHQGMDMVPSLTYYNTNRASSLTGGKVIQFATCSGMARYEIGYRGSNNVVIKCKDTDYSVTYMHLSTAFVTTIPVAITAGQPIGVMGSTGFSTGPHVHYQINKGCLDYSTACTRDPRPFISP